MPEGTKVTALGVVTLFRHAMVEREELRSLLSYVVAAADPVYAYAADKATATE